jgi:hypothetical protein
MRFLFGSRASNFWQPVSHNLRRRPDADLKRGDELVSKALALNLTVAYDSCPA